MQDLQRKGPQKHKKLNKEENVFVFLFFCGIIVKNGEREIFIKKKDSGKKAFIITLVTMFCIYLLAYVFNFIIKVKNYSIFSRKVSRRIRIAFLTDFHNSKYGEGQKKIISIINNQSPDIILLGGDFAEDCTGNADAYLLISKLCEEYPCFYVAGNHEFRSRHAAEIKQNIRECGAVVLEGEAKTIYVDGQPVCICGVDDYSIGKKAFVAQMDNAQAQSDPECFSVLISHRPDLEEIYTEYDFDLILSGHAHGGQWRIPFVSKQGLVTPDLKLFPKFTNGKRTINQSTHIVSSGLSKFTPPFPRIFNSPEIVIVDIIPD